MPTHEEIIMIKMFRKERKHIKTIAFLLDLPIEDVRKVVENPKHKIIQGTIIFNKLVQKIKQEYLILIVIDVIYWQEIDGVSCPNFAEVIDRNKREVVSFPTSLLKLNFNLIDLICT